MKTGKYFILVIVVFVLIAGFLAQATMSDAKDQSGFWIKEAFPTGKITDRNAFLVGAFFAQEEIRHKRCKESQIEYKKLLNSPHEQKDIMVGLEGVEVLVEGVKPKVEQYGLTQQLLQTDIELRLRQNGIRIVTKTDFDDSLKKYEHDQEEQIQKNLENMKPIARTLMDSLDEKNSDEHFLQCLREFIQHNEQQVSATQSSYLHIPTLYVNVNAVVFEESHRAAFSIQIKLNEGASLYRNAASCQAPIWDKAGVAGCSTSEFKEYARELLRDFLDEFINDYLAANPKDQSSGEGK